LGVVIMVQGGSLTFMAALTRATILCHQKHPHSMQIGAAKLKY